ncbi:MAG: class I SAM-dependent methyltransferase [Actinobacteria bacterium]|nr:class I SAM-dependent methyltransferase [Actinomycetota bacterium]
MTNACMLDRVVAGKLSSVPGWFFEADQALFRWFLSEQGRRGQRGDLAELGTYMGKSAILIGGYIQPGETFTVIDLFEDPADDKANQAENARTYEGFSQAAFQRHYLRFHDQLPVVVRGHSATIVEHASVNTHRWVHVDASHLYEHVRADLAAAQRLLQEDGAGGVVVCDDIRATHTPGVAAAVWEAVISDGLRPLVITHEKLYGTWSDPEQWLTALRSWLPTSSLSWELQQVAGHSLLRVWKAPPYEPVLRLIKKLLPARFQTVGPTVRNKMLG